MAGSQTPGFSEEIIELREKPCEERRVFHEMLRGHLELPREAFFVDVRRASTCALNEVPFLWNQCKGTSIRVSVEALLTLRNLGQTLLGV